MYQLDELDSALHRGSHQIWLAKQNTGSHWRSANPRASLSADGQVWDLIQTGSGSNKKDVVVGTTKTTFGLQFIHFHYTDFSNLKTLLVPENKLFLQKNGTQLQWACRTAHHKHFQWINEKMRNPIANLAINTTAMANAAVVIVAMIIIQTRGQRMN